MAIFYRTTDGDIYGGIDKLDIMRAIIEELGLDDSYALHLEEVPSDHRIQVTDENEEPVEGEFVTLAEEYGDETKASLVASGYAPAPKTA